MFRYVLFCNPTHKTETGTALRSYLLHCFLQVHSFAAPFTSHSKLLDHIYCTVFCRCTALLHLLLATASSQIISIALFSVGAQHWCAFYQPQQALRSFLLHCFLQVHSIAVPFTLHSKLCNNVEPNRHVLTFSSSNYTLQNHILSMAGNGLTRLWIHSPLCSDHLIA